MKDKKDQIKALKVAFFTTEDLSTKEAEKILAIFTIPLMINSSEIDTSK
jgi:hypothetical protein